MKIRKFIKKIHYLFLLVTVFAPGFLLAQQVPPKLQSPFKEGSGIGTIFDFLTFILNNIILPIGTVVAVFFLIYSGFLFVTARGNVEKLETAKKAFLGTIIGVVLLLGATAISLAIQGTICEIASIPGVCQ